MRSEASLSSSLEFRKQYMNEKIRIYLDRLAASSQKLNSFLFSGPDEEEKWEAAFYFIQKLFPKVGKGEFLEKAKKGIHPDVVILEPKKVEDKKGRIREKEIVIEQIREMHHRLRYFPYELQGKFCVIKKAHRMNEESSNALLKILEEPTANTFFFLLVEDVESILPTISSRCAILRFPQTKLPDWKEENRESFKRLLRADISEKFDYIEKICRDKNEFIESLKNWEIVTAEALRKLILQNESESKVEKVVKIIERVRESINQLEYSNASSRAVGEKLVLEIDGK